MLLARSSRPRAHIRARQVVLAGRASVPPAPAFLQRTGRRCKQTGESRSANGEWNVIWPWAGFITFVLLMLALDLGVFHRKAHVVSVKEALAWSAVWLAMGLAFAVLVHFAYDSQWLGLGTVADAVDGLANDGATATEKYLTGYVVEKSLSVDNIFVIAMIFGSFSVPPLYQHRVLFWGILGALLDRK